MPQAIDRWSSEPQPAGNGGFFLAVHEFATRQNQKTRANGSGLWRSGEPDRTLGNATFPKLSNAPIRDTRRKSGALKVNALPSGLGHGTAHKILSQYMKDAHKRMSRMLGYTLTIGTPEAWQGFRRVAQVRMTEAERAMLAFFMLNSLSEEHAVITAANVLGRAGDPLPPFLGGMEDARTWAAWASRNELKAYALASFEAMSVKDQAAFVQHINNCEVAI